MADITTKQCFSVIATTSERVKDLVIKSGQLIFIQDLGRIAFDFKNKRKFYNQIEELDTEKARQDLEAPINGCFYFVIESAVLWTYRNDAWVQITTPPNEVLFVGVEFPALGQKQTLYVNKKEKEISIWDDSVNEYTTVANYCDVISAEEVKSFFK